MMFLKERKDKMIQIRVTQKQKDLISKLAEEKQVTISDFILELIEKYYIENNK